MPSLATAFDVARLYDELRECVRANDQEGVKRVFSELVQARRPVSEILAEVKSLTKERETADTEAEKPETEEKDFLHSRMGGVDRLVAIPAEHAGAGVSRCRVGECAAGRAADPERRARCRAPRDREARRTARPAIVEATAG